MGLQDTTIHVRVTITINPASPLTIDRCMAHVVNLATIDVMSHITKIAVLETKTTIWEYDPALPANRISSGGLDVIATIRTLAIKVSITITVLTDCY